MGKKDQQNQEEFYPDISNTASAHECTGLMPTPPRSDEEMGAYEELFSMAIPKKEKKQKKK